MIHLIDKAAVVAEIDDCRDKILKGIAIIPLEGRQRADATLEYEILEKVRDFIDTLEVKEVDLEKYYHDFLQKEWFGKSHVRTISEMMAFTAKHFFELGLCNTITEEDCKLIWNIGDDLPYMPEENFFKELLRRYKAQKGEQYDRRAKEKG